jgi:hypothetical protein
MRRNEIRVSKIQNKILKKSKEISLKAFLKEDSKNKINNELISKQKN